MSSALFALPYLGYQPVTISNGEPALKAADLTKQTILGPPFKWAWNRRSMTFATNGVQDYLVPCTDYGFMETVWITDPNEQTKEIEVRSTLAKESAIQRPRSAAVQLIDLNSGYVLFRFNSVPDVEYQVEAPYQIDPYPMTSMASLWSPIPDTIGYIYDWGFLAMMCLLVKDARFPIFMQKFVSHLLGAQDGLTALQRNIFLGNWLDVMSEQTRTAMSTQQGQQARAV
jgi:hypothetical protein